MSEYQYYEFRTVDRSLNKGEIDELRSLSTRAEITATSFTNTYNLRGFPGKPREVDGPLLRRVRLRRQLGDEPVHSRAPRRILDVEAATEYAAEDALAIKVKEEHVLIDFNSQG